MGVKHPMIFGSMVISGGVLVALGTGGMPGLFAGAALIGLGHIFFHVSVHNLIGAYGDGEARTRNFATFSLGASVSAFFGPSLTGFAIDGLGFPPAFAMLAAIAVIPILPLVFYPRFIPRQMKGGREPARGSIDLRANPALRRTLLMSGVTLTGIELFTFYFPVYGRSIGLTASVIGLVMASYAVAAFIVRLGMHAAAKRMGEIGVLTASLFMAGVTYMLVPLVSHGLLLGLVAFLLGLGLGCAQPLTILLTYNHAPPGQSGEALGMRLTVNKITQIGVPVVFGGLGSAFGLIPVFWANGVFLLAAGFISLAERRIAARRDAAAVIIEQEEEEDTT
jgi:predicted MFS family arabinose efflux permease